ncbi:nucleotidyltransferase domain-containing protein [uncultured Algoriphagus sp.]|uniref:nucleotidyltransferase family protein n=1 Tax=Algoriphagus formosus TaxID=2007308 RepID=UPI00258EA409|nr:nucleotidyltransferase domain-containing protein [uncultured Algoriphagus sp.]
MNMLEKNTEAIKTLCEKHKVAKLYAFGSVLTSAFNEESDVDFLVEFNIQDIDKYVTNFFNLKDELETLFSREIDLIEYRAISNPYFKEEVDETKALLYESKN